MELCKFRVLGAVLGHVCWPGSHSSGGLVQWRVHARLVGNYKHVLQGPHWRQVCVHWCCCRVEDVLSSTGHQREGMMGKKYRT